MHLAIITIPVLPGALGFPCDSAGKESTCNSGDLSSIPGLGRSPGEGKGHPGKGQCRGPAPADPGYSKRGRRQRPIYIYLFIKDSKSNRMRIAQ